MKLKELQEVLGQEIEAVRGGGDVKQAQSVASLAKQIINIADVNLRIAKLDKIPQSLKDMQ